MGILVACSHYNRDSCLPAGQWLLFLCIRQWFPSWRPVFLLHLCSQKQQSASLPSLLLSTRFKPSQATPGSPQLHSCPGVPKSPRSTSIKSLLLLLLNLKRHLWRKTLEMSWKMPMCLSSATESSYATASDLSQRQIWGQLKATFEQVRQLPWRTACPCHTPGLWQSGEGTQSRLPCPAPAFKTLDRVWSVGWFTPDSKATKFSCCPHSPLLVTLALGSRCRLAHFSLY